MPTGFTAFIEVLHDPAANVDAFAHVEQYAAAIEKSVNPAAARQRTERLTCLRKIDMPRFSVILRWSLDHFTEADIVLILSPLSEPDRQNSKPLKASNRSFCTRYVKVVTPVARVGSGYDNPDRARGKSDEGIS